MSCHSCAFTPERNELVGSQCKVSNTACLFVRRIPVAVPADISVVPAIPASPASIAVFPFFLLNRNSRQRCLFLWLRIRILNELPPYREKQALFYLTHNFILLFHRNWNKRFLILNWTIHFPENLNKWKANTKKRRWNAKIGRKLKQTRN